MNIIDRYEAKPDEFQTEWLIIKIKVVGSRQADSVEATGNNQLEWVCHFIAETQEPPNTPLSYHKL